ncbi:hypothetical protein [Amycolatopsis methanolica]|uniref:hypothetical protein n=1 Tax=Amycolatopsis methanolica TaxID=1814 RepID=UPI0012E05B83|nr:hypothetical protein [Amycolatopsis methanolica]
MTDEAPSGRRSRLGQALREVDRWESLLRTARFVPRLVPGDSEMGAPLSPRAVCRRTGWPAPWLAPRSRACSASWA